MIPRIEKLVLVLILVSPFLGCTTVAHQAYRNRQCKAEPVTGGGEYDAECFVESKGGLEAGQCSTESFPEDGYDLAFVEFDDQGDYWEPCQLDRAIYLVDQANKKATDGGKKKRGALVVLFVHGWRNDASENNARDGNLSNFKKTLAELADLEAACIREARNDGDRARCVEPRPVVGIYVAWRGDYRQTIRPLRSIDWLFDWATFWNRDAAAQRIASRPIATQALLLLLENVKAENPDARVIAVGHSMGALLLEQAVSQTLVTRIIDKLYERRDRTFVPIQPLADLVVFVNSAAQAFRAQTLVDTLQIREVRLKMQPLVTEDLGETPPAAKTGPLLISVTANNDNATGWLFPKALSLGTLRQEFRPPADPGDSRPTEKYLARHTPGHTSQLFSHRELDYRKEERPCPPKEGTVPSPGGVTYCSESTGDGSTLAFSVQSREGFETYRLLREPGATNRSPYWILQVPPAVIDGHSKIFEQPFRDFLRGLIEVTGAVNPDYQRTIEAPQKTPKSVQSTELPGS